MRPSIQLSSGRFFDFEKFTPDDIDINDIAHSLSMLSRFTGHSIVPYSVGQHSVIVSMIVPPEYALAGLLHDATEAYINDMSRPLKVLNPGYVEFEKACLWPAVAEKFGLPLHLPQCIKDADNVALVTERRDFMPVPIGLADEWDWAKDISPLPYALEPWNWRFTKARFLERYQNLTGCVRPRDCGCRSCNEKRRAGI